MRSVKKSKKNIPPSLKSRECFESLKKIYNQGKGPCKDQIDSNIYRAKDVIVKLSNLYKDKCAYCEQKEPDFEIEHYRPKRRLAKIDNNDGIQHPGYYWLSYEWTNLIPACHDCNKSGVKGNRFPILNNRLKNPITKENTIDLSANDFESDHLKDEQALLIHPEENGFNPYNYFKFNSKGEIIPCAKKETIEFIRAQKTIEIVNLNRFKLHIMQRKKEIQNLKYQLKGLLLNFVHDVYINESRAFNRLKNDYFRILKQINQKTKPRNEFSFFWEYVYKHMDIVLMVSMKPKYRKLFLDLTQAYKKNNIK
ncbi:HNH endonuclease family protein [Marinigracilibium pacificum]|uniref:TIGR02646 family protein n=1 Tax=Marinigracilibium pacificum TaxID=2729599 RepID=A0A848J5P5_9BACT|nr:hypothetical protein [Marinigracilibium pacificum]NMM49840.1 hypothetical protein [Marinigracilibium pacificum]